MARVALALGSEGVRVRPKQLRSGGAGSGVEGEGEGEGDLREWRARRVVEGVLDSGL